MCVSFYYFGIVIGIFEVFPRSLLTEIMLINGYIIGIILENKQMSFRRSSR